MILSNSSSRCHTDYINANYVQVRLQIKNCHASLNLIDLRYAGLLQRKSIHRDTRSYVRDGSGFLEDDLAGRSSHYLHDG